MNESRQIGELFSRVNRLLGRDESAFLKDLQDVFDANDVDFFRRAVTSTRTQSVVEIALSIYVTAQVLDMFARSLERFSSSYFDSEETDDAERVPIVRRWSRYQVCNVEALANAFECSQLLARANVVELHAARRCGTDLALAIQRRGAPPQEGEGGGCGLKSLNPGDGQDASKQNNTIIKQRLFKASRRLTETPPYAVKRPVRPTSS
ncbi:hypothetical protein HPB50_022720 [Hyalomma asiaticum]|uniref:Uncharacterized protein n=1 Tax=Hyalomma asiaticum TaxID=266040 RepID=A0ACB7S8A4_HYAAI|nr:hypothetical protein HPB50_022720 [Hyalomma asiaticum]